MNYRFVREEPELYRLLFLMRSDDPGIYGGVLLIIKNKTIDGGKGFDWGESIF